MTKTHSLLVVHQRVAKSAKRALVNAQRFLVVVCQIFSPKLMPDVTSLDPLVFPRGSDFQPDGRLVSRMLVAAAQTVGGGGGVVGALMVWLFVTAELYT